MFGSLFGAAEMRVRTLLNELDAEADRIAADLGQDPKVVRKQLREMLAREIAQRNNR